MENQYTGDSLTIDPRDLAQRILQIRAHLAKEFLEDLKWVGEENADLLRETLVCSLSAAVTGDDLDDDGMPRTKQ